MTTSNELNTSHPSQNETNLSLQQQHSVQSVLPVHNISTYVRPDGSTDLVSESSLTTPSLACSSLWTNYFNRLLMGYEYSFEEKMQYEWLRVQSFQDFPVTCLASPLRLARTGFFSTGNNDEVKCFSCGVKYKNWKKKDNPIGVHHRISLECRMVSGRDTKNIPIITDNNGSAAFNVHQESRLSLFTDDFQPSTIHQNEDATIQTPAGALNRSITTEDTEISNYADTTSQLLNQPLQPYVVQDAIRQPVFDRHHSVLYGEQNRTDDKSEEENLSFSLERPKYPAYAQLSVRVSSFEGWPSNLQQEPRDMALAGFFYEGGNDYCRCFVCGGGLRNWEAGDDPWVEHARWFSKCTFIRQNRGHRSVEIIVKRQIEVQAANNSSGIADNHKGVSNRSGLEDRSQINSQETSSTPMITHPECLSSTLHQTEDVSIKTTEGAINRSLTREDIQISNDANTTSQSVNRTQQPHLDHYTMRQPVVDRNHSVLDGEQNRTKDKSKAKDLSISLERPKYQDYAQLNDRINTFHDWPEYLDHTPRDLALAGFFYTGFNDYCRCFFCGGGLRDWTAGVDPWVEHARWFSKCAFVRQNRGHRFVEIIIKRQAEMQAANNSSDIAENHTAVSNLSKEEDRTKINAQETSATPMITQSETNSAVESENIASSALLLPQHSQRPEIQPSVRKTTIQTATEILQASAAAILQQAIPVTTFDIAFDTASGRISGQASATYHNESSSLKEANTQYKEKGKCKTCNANNVPVAFLPCGHIDCCKECTSAMLKCPLCKVDIKQSLKRKVAVSSQIHLPQTGEDINVQNTQQSVLNNYEPSYEIQQLFGESEFHLGHAIPIFQPMHGPLPDDGSSVPRMRDDNTPIIRALPENHNFEGLPLIIEGSSVSSQFDNTCTIDTTLQIIFCQMFTNQNLYRLFANSIYGIFSVQLPDLLSKLKRRDFDNIRRVWSQIIGHEGRTDFYGSDADFVIEPFSSLLYYHERFNCTNFQCPSNEKLSYMRGLTLQQIPNGGVFNVTTLQQLLNNFASQLQCPCNERIAQTISESEEDALYVLCRGQLSITRTLTDIPEQPPMIIIDMGRLKVKRRNIGNLNGTVQIGSHRYYIGGLTFAANDHFLGRIVLPHINRTLLYCNGQGLISNNKEIHDSILSLIILFRIM